MERFITGHPILLYNGTVGKGDCFYFDYPNGFGNTPLAFLAEDLELDENKCYVKEANATHVTLELDGIQMTLSMEQFVKLLKFIPPNDTFSKYAV